MSYVIGLKIDTGGSNPASVGDDWNFTSNCSSMWCEAGADLAEFEGKTAGECIPVLESAISTLHSDPTRFRAMNPPNGWGSYETLIPALFKLLSIFRSHPKATVWVSL